MVVIISAEGMSRNFQIDHHRQERVFLFDSLVFWHGSDFILDIRGKRSQFIDVKRDTAAKFFTACGYSAHFLAKENVSPAEQNKLTFDFDAIQKKKEYCLKM
ncbi:MAG: hypothetical protein IPK57_09170 [Chitinophagaceae bacterium]|nr:hypothetical protein [Chitinophagaceae bacterium]